MRISLLTLPTFSTKLVTLKPCNYFQLVITTTVSVQFYFQKQVISVLCSILALYYLLLPPPWSDYRHHGRFYNSFLYYKYTSYTPYLAGSAAYLAGLIALHFLAIPFTCIIFKLYYHCISVLPLPTPCPFPPLK